MNVIIIEDEIYTARRLQALINECDPSINVIAMLESIADSVEWFQSNPAPDLVFLDIHLEDGLSFAIFDQVEVNVPIIFTTAFDEYAIKAFKLKSIDYLLKPIVKEDLSRAILKFKQWEGNKHHKVDLSELLEMVNPRKTEFRERFSVSIGDKLKTIPVSDVAYIFSAASITFAVTFDKHQYALDQSIDKFATELNPNTFFRVNRQFLVCHKALVNVHVYPKSRLKLELTPPTQEMVFVSIDKVPEFKRWLDGK
jgi:DNA-binding LytR/AlgR family response regulator